MFDAATRKGTVTNSRATLKRADTAQWSGCGSLRSPSSNDPSTIESPAPASKTKWSMNSR